MVDVILVVMLLVAGLTLGKGDAEIAAEPPRDPAAIEDKADSTPCTTRFPRLRDLGSHHALVNHNDEHTQGDHDGI
jgi:hypothetical protein